MNECDAIQAVTREQVIQAQAESYGRSLEAKSVEVLIREAVWAKKVELARASQGRWG